MEAQKLWYSSYGDRRNDIVFIGHNMNKEKMISKLNSCLIKNDDF